MLQLRFLVDMESIHPHISVLEPISTVNQQEALGLGIKTSEQILPSDLYKELMLSFLTATDFFLKCFCQDRAVK